MGSGKYLIKSRTKWIRVLLIVVVALFLLRGINMDRDRPSFGISLYDTVDEGIYAALSLDMYNNGGLSKGDYPLEGCGYTEPLMQTIVLNNALVYGMLHLIGDNYYALRLPMLIQGLIILLIILQYATKLISRRKTDPRWGIAAFVLVAVLLLTDFHYLMASVTFESSITRGLFLLLIWLVFRQKNMKTFWQFFWASLLSVISIFFVYLTNVFLVIPGVALIIYTFIKRGKKEGWHSFLGYGVGGISGMIPAELYYLLVWDSEAVMKALQVVTDFTGNDGANYTGNYSISLFNGFWLSAAKNLEHLFGNQNFFFNPLLAALFIFAIVYLTVKMRKNYRPEQCFVVFAAIGFTLQTMLSADFAERKFMVIYPILVVGLLEFVTEMPAVVQWAKSNIWKFVAVVMISGVTSAVCYLASYDLRKNRSMYYIPFEENNGFLWWFVTRMGLLVMLLFAVAGLLAILVVAIPQLRNHQWKQMWKAIFVFGTMALLVGICTNTYMSLRYYYTYNRYADRAICAKVDEVVGDNYMLGAYGLVFSFYNDAKVVYGDIETTSKYMDHSEIQFYFDYGHVDNQAYMDYYAPHDFYTWKKIVEMPRSITSSFGLEDCTEGIYIKTMKIEENGYG